MIWEIDEAAPAIEGIDGNGRPIPSYAASLGLLPAPFGRRAAATAVEVAIVLVLLLPLLVGALPAPCTRRGGSTSQRALADASDLLLIVVCASRVVPAHHRVHRRADGAARPSRRDRRQGDVRYPLGQCAHPRATGVLAR